MRHEPESKPIEKIYERLLSRGYTGSRIFEDWLDLMLYSLTSNEAMYSYPRIALSNRL